MEKLKNQAADQLTSPLGNLSRDYQPVDETTSGLIVDNVAKNELLLYPAGITKYDGETPRQITYKYLWDCGSKVLTDRFKVYLVPEPTNKYDKNAIRIQLVTRLDNGLDITSNLGYIPAKLSTVVTLHLDMFVKPGRIIKVRNDYYDKFYAAKIALPYKVTNTFNKILLSRFSDLEDQMIHSISYFIDNRGRDIARQISQYLTSDDTTITDLASFDPPEINKDDIVIVYGEKAKKIIDTINARAKIPLPALNELDSTYGDKEVRQLTFEQLKKLKEALKKPVVVEEEKPKEILTEKSIPALSSRDVLKMMQDTTEWTGITQDGKTIRLTVNSEKGKADICMTFAELYMLRLAIDTLKVTEIEIKNKANS